jgi:predicted DsbA family dithiol-disulfide isomerase
VAYWIIIDGTSWLDGVPPKTGRVGPFLSREEAESAEPEHLPWDTNRYVYHVHIEQEFELRSDAGEPSGDKSEEDEQASKKGVNLRRCWMAYWIVVEAWSTPAAKKPLKTPQRFGPFASEREAEREKLNYIPRDDDGYDYSVHIESEQAINLEHAPAKGPADARVCVVEFSDFASALCAAAQPIVNELLSAYPAQVWVAFKHYPRWMSRESQLAHEASLAAGEQGRFWEMNRALFAGQDKLSHDDLIAKAKRLDLDIPRFTQDLDTRRFLPQVDADRQEGNRLGVDGAPFFFINGRAISGDVGLADLKKLVDEALKGTAAP